MLTPLAYETLRLFAEEGMEVPAIADATGQPWLTVRNLLNVHADGHRTKAKRLLDEQKAPTREEVTAAIAAAKSKQPAGPLVEPIAKPKPPPAPKPAPEPAKEPTVLATIPVPLDDLDGVADVMAVATAHPEQSIRDKAARVSEAFAELRGEIIRYRRGEAMSAARARMAELEAELASLRQMVGEAA